MQLQDTEEEPLLRSRTRSGKDVEALHLQRSYDKNQRKIFRASMKAREDATSGGRHLKILGKRHLSDIEEGLRKRPKMNSEDELEPQQSHQMTCDEDNEHGESREPSLRSGDTVLPLDQTPVVAHGDSVIISENLISRDNNTSTVQTPSPAHQSHSSRLERLFGSFLGRIR